MMGGNKEKFHYYMGDQPPSTSTSLPPRPSPTATTKTKKTKEKMCIETDDSESVLSPLEGLMDISSSSDDEQLEVPSRLTIQRKQQPAVVTAAVVVERKQGKIEGVLKKKEPDIRKKEKRREWVFEDSLSQPTTVTLKKRKMHGKNNLFKSHSQPTTTATAVTTAATASRFELDLSDDDAFNVKSTASSSTTTKTTHKLSKKSFTKCNNINSDSDDILQGPLPWLNAGKKSRLGRSSPSHSHSL